MNKGEAEKDVDAQGSQFPYLELLSGIEIEVIENTQVFHLLMKIILQERKVPNQPSFRIITNRQINLGYNPRELFDQDLTLNPSDNHRKLIIIQGVLTGIGLHPLIRYILGHSQPTDLCLLFDSVCEIDDI